MSSTLARIAQPGDRDLDIDLDGLTITAVVRLAHEFLIRATDGFGRFRSTDDTWAEYEPGADTAMEVQFNFGMPDASEQLLAEYQNRLERWRDSACPLHLCGAPGKMFSLIEDRSIWLSLPRTQR